MISPLAIQVGSSSRSREFVDNPAYRRVLVDIASENRRLRCTNDPAQESDFGHDMERCLVTL